MTPPVYFALGFHCHQPVGNFDWVLEENLHTAYRPLLEELSTHPRVPFCLHLTGPLLEWLESAHPDYLDLVARLAASGQLEITGGPFYECILPLVPSEDRLDHLLRMRAAAERRFGVSPRGAWIPERVWEPQLARDLNEAGIEYAFLDDAHFRRSGVEERSLYSYFLTEDQGFALQLFPISRALRYLVPFAEPTRVRTFLRERYEEFGRRLEAGTAEADAPPPLVVCQDDGEKFGAWPGTFDHVYTNGWLRHFLAMLEEASAEGWLRLTTPGAYRDEYPPARLVYVGPGSYPEMQEWSGGNFRSFLTRYPESNRIHKRSLRISQRARRRLAALEASGGMAVELSAAAEARACSLRAQCNDAYWHGVFGGLYLPHLRQGVYANLIRAEALLPAEVGVIVDDFDCDGQADLQLRSDSLLALVAPRRGGTLWALDHLASTAALLDTMQRKREPEHDELERAELTRTPSSGDGVVSIHHRVLVKEPNLHRLIRRDPWPRDSLLDHFFAPGFRWEDLHDLRASECGDFAAHAYEVLWAEESAPHAVLSRVGFVAGAKVRVDKDISLARDAARLRALYRVTVLARAQNADTLGAPVDEVWFAPELTINLLAGDAPGYYVLIDGVRPRASAPADGGTHLGAHSVTLVDGTRGLHVRLSWEASMHRSGIRPSDSGQATTQPLVALPQRDGEPITDLGRRTPMGTPTTGVLHRYGVFTVSQSEAGFEKVFQGTALVPSWPLQLRAGTILEVELLVEVTQRDHG